MQHEDSFKTILYLGDKLFLKFLFPFNLLGCTECEGNWKVFSLIFVTRANSNISFLPPQFWDEIQALLDQHFCHFRLDKIIYHAGCLANPSPTRNCPYTFLNSPREGSAPFSV